MAKKYILALDQGTSSSRAVIFNENTEIVGIEQTELNQIYPKNGWVEQNPEEIWNSQYKVALEVLTKCDISVEEIAAIGITNQRETTVIWDKNTGIPIYNAIVWQDNRTASFCNKIKEQGYEEYIKNNTGLVVDSYFSATKIYWILNNVKGAKEKAENGELLFGTIDTWLVWKLTGGKLHITDYSNASRTLLYNIHSLKWDEKLLNLFEIPSFILPEVKSSSEKYGFTDNKLFGGSEIQIAGIAGDQQAALFGQTCFEKGMAKNTYGTGCFMLMNTGTEAVKSDFGLLSTIAWGIDNEIIYALEGSVFMAGAAIKWLRDGIKLISNASETFEIAKNLNSRGCIYVVPAFSGLGAPYWDMKARGAIFGITQNTTDKHIVTATLESIAYRTRDVLDAMSKDSKIKLTELNVDGGAAVNDYLMQFQSDILKCEVVRPEIIETTALGAASLAGIAVGLWTKDSIIKKRKTNRIFSPEMSDDEINKLYKGWLKAIEKSQAWEDE
ncbi:MAG: glycerol kinase GlpK [Bacteroidales bacterium]|nr:glycerol kinase GlpK [Bacteroidales bacterium]MBN2758386.1 glycerol kinase GlpK [Bacteroidales bacterium]